MIKITDIAFTGYPVTDMGAARHFYEKILGLTPEVYTVEEGKSWVEYTLPTGTLAISDVDPNWKTGSGPSIGLEVADMTDTLSFLKEKGIVISQELFEGPVCTIAVIKDPDGNLLMLHKKKACHPDCQDKHQG